MFSMEDDHGTPRPVTLISGSASVVSSLSDAALSFLLAIPAKHRERVAVGIDFWGPQKYALSRVSYHKYDKQLDYILRKYMPEVTGYYAQQAPSCGWHLNTMPGSYSEYQMPALFEEVAFHSHLSLTDVEVIQRNRMFSYFHGDVLRMLLFPDTEDETPPVRHRAGSGRYRKEL